MGCIVGIIFFPIGIILGVAGRHEIGMEMTQGVPNDTVKVCTVFGGFLGFLLSSFAFRGLTVSGAPSSDNSAGNWFQNILSTIGILVTLLSIATTVYFYNNPAKFVTFSNAIRDALPDPQLGPVQPPGP